MIDITKKALFLSLDETVITTKSGRAFPLHSDDWKLNNVIIDVVRYFVKRKYTIIIVTNQKCIRDGYIPEKVFLQKIEAICKRLEYHTHLVCTINYWYCIEEGFNFKPNPGMAYEAATDYEITLSHSVMVGNTDVDSEFAERAGIPIYYSLADAHAIDWVNK